MKYRIYISLLILLLSLCFSAIAAETYTFVGANFPLLLEEREDGTITGLAYDIVKEIEKKMDSTFNVQIHPWARAYKSVQDGEADVLVGPYKTKEREEIFDFSSFPFYEDLMVFYTINPNSWNGNYANLKGLRIGIGRSWSYGEKFDNAAPNLHLVPVETMQQSFQMLQFKRIDLVASNSRNAQIVLQELGMTEEVTPLFPPINQNESYFAFTKKNSQSSFKNQFDAALKELIDSGKLDELLQKYGLIKQQ